MKPYEEAVNNMMQLLLEREVCLWSRNSHKKCYEEFGIFLLENDLTYSKDNVFNWMENAIKLHNSRQEYAVRWIYMAQLSELMETGTVKDDHLLLTKSYYNKLPKSLRLEIDKYLDSREVDYTKESLDRSKIYCSRFLLYLNELGVSNIQDLKYYHIRSYFEEDHHCSSKTRLKF